MIIVIENDLSSSDGRMISSPTKTISKIVGYFKQSVSRTVGFSPWQRSFHDHVIRDDVEYNKIAQYIENNPALWKDDCFYYEPINT
jgi:REP element-mobilizing transposase RayT